MGISIADINAVATQFSTFYYATFDSDRAALAPLYRDGSMLSFEGEQFQGSASIVEKLTGLSFQKVAHKVLTMDAQPTSPDWSTASTAAILVAISGQLMVDDSPHPLAFNQTFHLLPEGGSYFVFNDVFRLNYG